MKNCRRVWLKFGIACLMLLLFGLWQSASIIVVTTASLLFFCMVMAYFQEDGETPYTLPKSIRKWLIANEDEMESLFCIFVESSPKGLFHSVLDHENLDDLYQNILSEMQNYFGCAHVRRISRDQYVVLKEFPSAQSIEEEQKTQYQRKVTHHISEQIQNIISSYDERAMQLVEISIGCAASGIRYRVGRIEELLELAYFTMKSAQEDNQPFIVANESIRARKFDIEECKVGFLKKHWEQEFNPFFQPIVDPISFRVVGLESLARWQLGGFRILSAQVFKDLAYEMHRISTIDTTIIRKTFAAVKELKDEGLVPYGFRVVINVSAVSLTKGSVERLCDWVAEYELHPEHIEFDIKDTILSDPEVSDSISALRTKGFRIALDAFDEEAFDLKAFFQNNFDIIKLNFSLYGVKNWNSDHQGPRVFDSLMDMAQHLQIETLAKGIESRMQLDAAKELGAAYLQGNYFTPPIPLSDFRNFMQKYREGLYLDAYIGASELA
jgi:EAL domain-containing protein (putative c-di-GMP-specific phosphodiesterase class I)